jgi:uncharacterized DUF497 family protein
MNEASGGIEFDWDSVNTRHLKRHRVTPAEFEELMNGEPFYVEYQVQNDEQRYKVLGVTKTGRVLIGIWTPGEGRIRAITAYAASRVYRDLYRESIG